MSFFIMQCWVSGEAELTSYSWIFSSFVPSIQSDYLVQKHIALNIKECNYSIIIEQTTYLFLGFLFSPSGKGYQLFQVL